MAYRTVSDLPKALRKQLPRHAQELYLAAYSRTWEKCAASEDYQDERSMAETAHKAGLFAVEMEYEKDEHGQWRRAPVGEAMDKSKIRKEA
ncbi:MAG: ChaB family protein [Gammaproteobacteria bacterium]